MRSLRAQGPTSAPRRSARPASSSTTSTARSATARRATARATPRRTCSPGRATSPPGKFKVRTTPNGALPTHQDLVNIIRRGMPYTSMPAWPNLTDQRASRTSPTTSRRSRPTSPTPSRVPKPVDAPERAARLRTRPIAQGKKLYDETGCARCHGDARSRRRPVGADAEGRLRSSDPRRGPRRSAGPSAAASTREDIFRTMSTGFNGTPMPAFVDGAHGRAALGDHRLHRLAVGSDGPGYANLVRRQARRRARSTSRKGAASFAAAPVARFPIVGQIMEPGRSFHPPATSVTGAGDLRRRSRSPCSCAGTT